MPTQWTPGTQYHGFELLRQDDLPGLRAVAREFRHGRTGARLLHLHAADAENCFAVIFPTPPPDDTGLPHIMEHAVLGGSRKYPVREPFFEMAKISMATFINAMTSQTFTVYPICSNVKKDFFNLADVYLDAVFHPLIDADLFRREGHHLTLEDNEDLDSPLTISGIVYSEMKGAYSSPEAMMWRIAGRGLFPDTALGRDSGGDPEAIPALTFEQFQAFHRDYYHPGNALVFVYGDIPTEEHLAFVAPVLNAFGPGEGRASQVRQTRWPSPRREEAVYPLDAHESLAGKTFLTLNWLVGDALDPQHTLDLAVVFLLLLGDDAAPLKKALIDSKLGADVFMAYADGHAQETVFHVGIKGSEPERAEAFEKLVLDTLGTVAGGDIPPSRVLAAYQRLAYEHLEVTSQFPLELLWRAADAWPYGSDPLPFLRLDGHLAENRRRYDADPGRFQRLIRAFLIDNPHRLRVILRPDHQERPRKERQFAEAMAARKAAMSPEEVAAIARSAAALEEAQGVANPPEAIAKLPQLQVGDLPAKPREIPTTPGRVAGMTVLRNDVFSNGVNYLDIAIDLAGLPDELLPLLPRFQDAFAKMGIEGQSFTTVAERRSSCTGSLYCHPTISRHAADETACLRYLRVGLKVLDDLCGEGLDLLGDLLFRLDPADSARLRDLLVQSQAGYRTRFTNDGMGVATRRACRGISPVGALAYRLNGRGILEQVDHLVRHFDAEHGSLVNGLLRIRDFLLDPRRWTVSFTGSDASFGRLENALQEWAGQMPSPAKHTKPVPELPFVAGGPCREGMAGPYDVSFCVQAMPAPVRAHPDAPLFGLGIYIARYDYLLPEIRFKGNAYGAGMGFDSGTGCFTLHSYRDPRLTETLQVFAGLRRFVEQAQWTQTEIDRAIIGSAKGVERPIRPEEATHLALSRHLCGDTPELRATQYARSLRATPAEVKRALLQQWDANHPKSVICVASNRARLEAANRELGEAALAVEDVLPA